MEKVRVGIIGIGNMGSQHAKNILAGKVPGMELSAICDISEERREFAKNNYGDIAIFDEAEKMIESDKVDAVIIAVPHYFHPEYAIKSFEKGLHVLCEKPAGVYTKQVLEMNEAAKKSDKVFSMMYNQRTNPMYLKLRELIKSGALGAIKRVNWIITDWYRPQAYHDSASWRSTWKDEGGGTLINQNPHQLDLWQWLFGMPDKIMSHVSYGKYYNIETEDDVTAFMQYDNGMTGVYITSTGEWPGTNRLEVACDMGKVVIENGEMKFYRNVVSEREHNKTNTKPFGHPEAWECKIPVQEGVGEQHVGVLKSFTNAILKGEPLLAPGEEGVLGLTISNAIHLSSWTGEWADLNNFPHDEFYNMLSEKIKNSTYVKKETKAKVENLEGTYGGR